MLNSAMTYPLEMDVEELEIDVEEFEIVETTHLSELVANFARVHILISLFDGNPEAWLRFLDSNGTEEERRLDRPFVESMRRRVLAEPRLVDDMRRLMHDFSSLFARQPLPA